jgi:hypothetical protein
VSTTTFIDCSDLSRFGIRVDVPPPLAMLIADVFNLLPTADAGHFIARIKQHIHAGIDHSSVPARFQRWLLTDPNDGLVNLAHRPDVRNSVEQVTRNVLALLAEGIDVRPDVFQSTLLIAELVQAKTWNAYRHAQPTPYVNRVEWLVAAAATESIRPHGPSSLAGAMHGAAVAWLTVKGNTARTRSQFYQAVSNQLVALIAQQPLPSPSRDNMKKQIAPGDRVGFDDAQDGPQTGTVISFVDSGRAPATVLIEVDHSLPGVTWTVPVPDLSPLEPVSA